VGHTESASTADHARGRLVHQTAHDTAHRHPGRRPRLTGLRAAALSIGGMSDGVAARDPGASAPSYCRRLASPGPHRMHAGTEFHRRGRRSAALVVRTSARMAPCSVHLHASQIPSTHVAPAALACKSRRETLVRSPGHSIAASPAGSQESLRAMLS